EFSKKFGATHTINPTKDKLDEAVTEITGGRGADIAVEAAGYPDTLEAVLRLVTKFGKVIIFGVQGGAPGSKTSIESDLWMRNLPTIIPTVGAASGDAITHIENMIELKARGWWDPGEMVTHNIKFDEVQRAYDMYENRDDLVVKVVMSM
ncbi:MAG: zinc-binding dehydrogenase, partial [Chloroflexi bacterium]|nr:zinc-binding dehydrogenase [Chloroflexota bacterium]